MVLREALVMEAISLPVAFVTPRFLQLFLIQMKSNDPLARVAVAALAAALAAGYGPACRASRVDPWTALRDE